jgi:hypothetical protein
VIHSKAFGRNAAFDSPHLLTQELFRDAILRERHRADRFEAAFVLVLISLNRAARQSRWEHLVEALSQSKFDADVVGWFDSGGGGDGFTGITPTRLLDTRDGTGGVPATKLTAGQTLEVSVAGKLGLPATGIAAVSLNLTATEPEGPGYITAYPCGERPLASNVNYVTGQTIPNAVIAPVSPTGTICLYTLATTHLLADVSGWFAGATTS